MREVLPALLAAHARGESVALATLVRTWRSAPRPPGAAMLVTASGEAVGSVSGGCVEGALYELGTEVLRTGEPALEAYGVSDDDAFAAGLSCGGSLEVFVERISPADWPQLAGVASSLQVGEPVAVATVVRGPAGAGRHLVVRRDAITGSLGSGHLDAAVQAEALQMLASGISGLVAPGTPGDQPGSQVEVFVASYAPPPRLYVIGAVDVAAPLCGLGRLLGYHVTVVDARAVFATRERFPDADEVVVDWPHRWLGSQQVEPRTAICVLTHDPKFDVPALTAALRTPAAYIGALGSRRTHADRVERLREAGVAAEDIGRLRAPIGLDLGAREPAEIALSIMAEVVQGGRGGSGGALSGGSGPLHPGDGR